MYRINLFQISYNWVIKAIEEAGGMQSIIDKCDGVIISNSTEHRIHLSEKILKNRALFFKMLKILQPESSNKNDNIIKAIKFIQDTQHKRTETINTDLNLNFASEFWKKRIQNAKNPLSMNRKELETCVIEYTSKALNSGDLYVKGAKNFADYRADLMPWSECLKYLDEFCLESKIPNNSANLFSELKSSLESKSKFVDDNYHNIPDFVINDDGKPVLKKYDPKPKSESAEKLEGLIKTRLTERSLLDVLINAEYYANWTSECGPLDGKEAKLDNPTEKYVLTPFAMGTGLGPTQMSKHLRLDFGHS